MQRLFARYKGVKIDAADVIDFHFLKHPFKKPKVIAVA
jgi:hypothetical protein